MSIWIKVHSYSNEITVLKFWIIQYLTIRCILNCQRVKKFFKACVQTHNFQIDILLTLKPIVILKLWKLTFILLFIFLLLHQRMILVILVVYNASSMLIKSLIFLCYWRCVLFSTEFFHSNSISFYEKIL